MHPCREMCRDFLEGCWKKMKDLLARMGSEFREKHGTWYVEFLPSVDKLKVVNCDYRPSLQGSIPCFYKPVTCDSPLDVTNGTRILDITQKDVYQLHDVVQYACVNEGFEIIGNSFIPCMYSGQWSQSPPKCTDQRNNSSIHVLYIVLPILILPLIVLLTTLIIFKVKSKTIHVLPRAREFDVFVCYKFDTDNGYVVNVILKNLEEMCEPPLKLCVHERDFIPGLHIKDNIKDAITKSNSAVIVLSHAFIDSDWCQEEFTHCYLENMQDPAFEIFMIMIQPAEYLDNLSEYMQSFMESRTYLSKYDPKLFPKIMSYVHWVKLLKDERNRKIPRFETCEAFLRIHDKEDNLTDGEIEHELVPLDPYLSTGDRNEEQDDDDIDDQTTKLQEKRFKREEFQFEAEAHYGH